MSSSGARANTKPPGSKTRRAGQNICCASQSRCVKSKLSSNEGVSDEKPCDGVMRDARVARAGESSREREVKLWK